MANVNTLVSTWRPHLAGKKMFSSFCAPFYTENQNICRDRLGTNIEKTHLQDHLCSDFMMTKERKNELIGYEIVNDDATHPDSNVCICTHECECFNASFLCTQCVIVATHSRPDYLDILRLGS